MTASGSRESSPHLPVAGKLPCLIGLKPGIGDDLSSTATTAAAEHLQFVDSSSRVAVLSRCGHIQSNEASTRCSYVMSCDSARIVRDIDDCSQAPGTRSDLNVERPSVELRSFTAR